MTAASLDTVGSAYLVEGRQREAIGLLQQAIGALRKDYARGNPLFEEALDLGTRIGDADPTFAGGMHQVRGAGILTRIFGPDTLGVALTEVSLAEAARVGDYRECGDLLDQSYAIEQKEFSRTTSFAHWSYVRAQLDEKLGREA